MLKVRPIQMIEYLTQSASDGGRQTAYYTDSNLEPPGQWWCPRSWIVADAERASASAVSRLSQGRDPETGKKIVTGNRVAKRAGFDLTFSAPNAFSVLWTVAGPDGRKRLDEMLMSSVRETLDEISESKMIEARRGKNGAQREAVEAPVAALYRHTTSRGGDPQAHVHAVLLMAGLRQDGTIGAVNNERIMKAQRRLGAAFRLRLAAKLEAVGVPVEADPECGFLIRGQPTALLACWSKRRTAILEKARELGMSGTKGHAAAADAIALETRGKKSDLPPRYILERRWRQEAMQNGWSRGDEWSRLDRSAITRPPEADQQAGQRVAEEALQRVSDTQSLFDRGDLEYAALTLAVGRSSLSAVRHAIESVVAAPQIIHTGNDKKLTTQAIVAHEREIVRIARQRQAEPRGGFRQAAITAALADPRYTDEQRQAIRHVLSAAGVAVTLGGSGVGKTTAAAAIAVACRVERRRLILAAPSWTAAEILMRELKHAGPGVAMDKLLRDIETSKMTLRRGDVVLIDEAGMVGTRQAHDLMVATAKAGAFLRLMGDSRQIASVSRGDPLSLIECAIGGSSIRRIRRQKVEWQKIASMAARDGRVTMALAAYHRHAAVTVAPDVDGALDAAARAFRAAGGDAAAVAATNAAVARLNARLRAEMAAMNLLSGPELKIRAIPRGQKNLKTVKPVTLALRAGDRLILGAQAEIGGVTLRNAARTTVHEIGLGGRIVLDAGAGRLIETTAGEIESAGRRGGPATLQHGYAVTIHAAQGASWRRSIWLAGPEDARSALVALTRHKEALNIVIDRSTVPMREPATTAVSNMIVDQTDSVDIRSDAEIVAAAVSGSAMPDPTNPVDSRSDAEIVASVGQSMTWAANTRNALDVLGFPAPGRIVPGRPTSQRQGATYPWWRRQRSPALSREATARNPSAAMLPDVVSPPAVPLATQAIGDIVRGQEPDRAAGNEVTYPTGFEPALGEMAHWRQTAQEPAPAASPIEADWDNGPAPEM